MTKPRVLVIDDEPQLLRALRINLSARGYEVSTAAGATALRAAAEHRPDVIILDLGLPDMDGIDVLRCARLAQRAGHRAFGPTDSGDKVQALDAGADDYVTKPFGMDEFPVRPGCGLPCAAPPRRLTPMSRSSRPGFLSVSVDLAAKKV